jgi:hypothetical protein
MPYDGRVMVVDNNYLYPTVADRTFPPSPADPAGSLRFTLTDPLDQLTGHEVGHALSLDHRNNTMALMNPTATDNSGNTFTDNINLNAAEVSAIRANALIVPGLETDPPGQFDPGNFVAQRFTDKNLDANIPPHLDLASVKVVLDRQANQIHIGQQLMGLVPKRSESTLTYAYLVDTDNNDVTGCSGETLQQWGIQTDFTGADLAAIAEVKPRHKIFAWHESSLGFKIQGDAFVCQNGQSARISHRRLDFQIHTLRMHPHFADVSDERQLPRDFVADVNNTIHLRIDNTALPFPIALDTPFRLQAVVMENGVTRDRLDDQDVGETFQLELPSFPHCFPQGEGRPGETVEVDYDGLVPTTEIHALLGPELVLDGVFSDADGEGSIQLPIPLGARRGLHLVTIGHDGLALTADCTVNVVSLNADTICDSLGSDARHALLDQDRFEFSGLKGEEVTISLDVDQDGENNGGSRATLRLKDKHIRGVWLHETEKGDLKNQITTTLPADGEYLVIVGEQPHLAKGDPFKGDYCLTVEDASGNLEAVSGKTH